MLRISSAVDLKLLQKLAEKKGVAHTASTQAFEICAKNEHGIFNECWINAQWLV